MNETQQLPTLPALLVLLALAGCASGPPPSPSPSLPAPPEVGAPAGLAAERQWLSAWFKGTPVVIGQLPNGAVTVDVPREFCFDPGQDAVKPPLAAVLDKVAQSMRRAPGASLHLIAAPADASGGSALALKRATRVRESLRSHGIPEPRLGKPSAAGGAAVQLRIDPASPA